MKPLSLLNCLKTIISEWKKAERGSGGVYGIYH